MQIPQLFHPIQTEFGEDDVRNMSIGRRQLRTQWPKLLYPPDSPQTVWRLVLPFPESYENAYRSMCSTKASPNRFLKDQLCLFLEGSTSEPGAPQDTEEWLETVGKYVAIKDRLALSFALDYDRECGDPKRPQTEIGLLRTKAKPYGDRLSTNGTRSAADKLAEKCLAFLVEMTCYESANCVVAMPPSDPTKEYNLPRRLAGVIAKRWNSQDCQDLTRYVRTIKTRQSIKEMPHQSKLDTLLGTIEVDRHAFAGKRVLLIDDLYQSGTSMNYCAYLLRQAGATKIFGLACEKTCTNDDNIKRRT